MLVVGQVALHIFGGNNRFAGESATIDYLYTAVVTVLVS